MRYRLLIFVSILFFSCNREKVSNLSTDEGIEGKVKFISEMDYDAKEKFGEIAKDVLLFKITYKYDEKGNEIEESSSDSEENVISKIIYSYDKSGNAIESNRYNDKDSLMQKFVFTYNEDGKVVQRNDYFTEDSLDHRSIFKYNNEGKVLERSNYYSDGSLDDKMVYDYIENGNVVVISCYNSMDSVTSKTISKYENDKEVESNFYSPASTLWLTTTNKYDEKGLLIENVYSEVGRPKKVYKYEYKFDKHGNWIIKNKFLDNKPNQVTEREIEYY